MPSSIIEADRLVKFYGKAKEPALDELGLKVPEGRIFTLLGRNEAGKTTFLRIATTQLLPTSGSVHVFYLLSLIPYRFRRLAELVPTTHSSVLIQSAVGLPVAGSEMLASWLALPCFTVAFLLLALFKAKWRES